MHRPVKPFHYHGSTWWTLRSGRHISLPWYPTPSSSVVDVLRCRTLYDGTRHYSSRRLLSPSDVDHTKFKAGDCIQVEVTSFGPLGASVAVVGLGHEGELLPVDQEPYGYGLISQREIAFFREARDNVDVVRGEILSAYVQKVRVEDGKINVGLRAFGGKAKTDQFYDQILKKLEASPQGSLPVGDKSTPEDISRVFPGVSKSVFKKAVGALYKNGLVSPSPFSISLVKK